MLQHPEIPTLPYIQEYLRIGRRQVYERCEDANFLLFHIGKSIRIPREGFFELLARDEKEPVDLKPVPSQQVE